MTDTEAYEQEVAELSRLFSTKWGLQSFYEMPTQTGVAFNGKVTFENLFVATVFNHGDGGPNTISWAAENENDWRHTVGLAQADWRSIAGMEAGTLREEAAIEALLKYLSV